MAYEFADEDPTDNIPTVPDFWHAKTERIFQVFPFMPTFIAHHSIAEDPETLQLGIDTNDKLPVGRRTFGDREPPMGMMRVETVDRTIDGYIIDLRYAQALITRDLNFDSSVYKDEDPNDQFKTVPVLAAIFYDPGSEELRLRTKQREPLKDFAVSLMRFVDAERYRRGLAADPGSAIDEAKHTDLRVRFSARPQESTPDAD